MSRRNAAIAGAVAWLALLGWATTFEDSSAKALLIWGVVTAVLVAFVVVVSRALSGLLKRAVLKDRT